MELLFLLLVRIEGTVFPDDSGGTSGRRSFRWADADFALTWHQHEGTTAVDAPRIRYVDGACRQANFTMFVGGAISETQNIAARCRCHGCFIFRISVTDDSRFASIGLLSSRFRRFGRCLYSCSTAWVRIADEASSTISTGCVLLLNKIIINVLINCLIQKTVSAKRRHLRFRAFIILKPCWHGA
jgi:hypothetical protein